MEISIIVPVDFNQQKCSDVVLLGTVSKTEVEDIVWDRTLYTTEENNLIETVAFKSTIYDRLFEKYDEEISERILDNF